MNTVLKKILFQIIITLLFFSLVEIAFCSIEYFYPSSLFKNQPAFQLDSSKKFAHIQNFDRTHFCDPIHVNESGHMLISACLADFFTKSVDLSRPIKIFALGGSTTEGRDCSSKNRWSDQLEKDLKNIKVLNFGKAGQNSSYDLEVLKKKLESGNIPDYVLWGNWVNELLANEIENNNYAIKIFLFKIYNTLYKYLHSARFISNYYNESQRDFSLIDAANTFSDESDKFINFSNLYENTKNDIYSKSLEHYSKNVKLLAEFSTKYKFKVIVQGFPFIKKFYSRSHPRLDTFFEGWVKAIKNQQFNEAAKYDFKFVDVQPCFEQKRNSQDKK